MFVKYALIMVNSFLAYKNLRKFMELYFGHISMSVKFENHKFYRIFCTISVTVCDLALSTLLLLFYA